MPRCKHCSTIGSRPSARSRELLQLQRVMLLCMGLQRGSGTGEQLLRR